jgi:branched-chain amino acid transport system substrate-binding protein
MTNAGNINKVQITQYAQFIPKNLIFAATPYMNAIGIAPRVQAQRTAFLAAMRDFGVANPDNSTIAAWDPLLIMIDGLRQIGPGATATQLRDYILKVHDFAGIQGMYDFRRGDQHGIDPHSSPVVRFDGVSGDFPVTSKPGGLPL